MNNSDMQEKETEQFVPVRASSLGVADIICAFGATSLGEADIIKGTKQ